MLLCGVHKKGFDMSDQENANALKHMYDLKLLTKIANAILLAYPEFDARSFLSIKHELDALEMKARVYLIRERLYSLLPNDYSKALFIILRSARQGQLEGFALWPYTEFIQTYGLDDLDISLKGLRELTQAFTSEWGVRPFINKSPDKTIKFLKKCAIDKNVHVRRWASEGTRPRLPWGERLHQFIKDPSKTTPILEKLKFDSELYVRKSVSNHLNDIAKDHPEYVIRLLKKWSEQAGDKHREKIDWIIKRSLRTLIKDGNPAALKLVGVSTKANIKVKGLKIVKNRISVGDKLDFSFKIHSLSKRPQKLVIDYSIHFVKSNGSTSQKVFKLKNISIDGGAVLEFSKSHSMKKITTRDYYPGTHKLEVQVNGIVQSSLSWILDT
jgi:3-methyladenine DNA glycosylase AlkC